MVRILIVDDHEMVRLGIVTLLEGTEFIAIAQAKSGKDAVRLSLKHEPDVVLLDVRLPEGDGMSALARIKLERPNVCVVMLSAFDNPMWLARAIALGANGYLLKTANRQQLLATIRAAVMGEMTWSREDLRRVSYALRNPRLTVDVEVALTQRELDIVVLLTDGLTNKEIASRIGIGYETVKEYVQRVLVKIGVRDRTQAALWAVRNRLVAP